MNGYPVVVFVDGAFDCVVLCATNELAHAWVAGAKHGSRRSEVSFLALPTGRLTQRGVAAIVLDDVLGEEMVSLKHIGSAERRKAAEALERSKSKAFPAYTTIVK